MTGNKFKKFRMFYPRKKRRIPGILNPCEYNGNPWNLGSTMGIPGVRNPPFLLNRLAMIFIYPDWDVKVDSVVDEISKSNRLRVFYVLFLADF
jgi:hypothetical protein